ncbi:hypothetical protein F0L17_22465 [Streptomyces sp. TRM43335]|uniref:Uncharacterized protein n=1 Tax=Streptomyces taklimakanensis TaxID=2569853 RepID=A0A6G2BI76_9ACTN|nr:daptide-type RiPP [Streptomyces taklimakanensis]MTE21826.1 hypothetical protein [Streptomyces taklimakanensis]
MQTIVESSAALAKQDNSVPALELGMQELEAMEAPGFYTGFKDGLTFSLAVSTLSVGAIAVT